MSMLAAAIVASEESGMAEHGATISPYVFGGVAFAVLGLLLIITLMIDVDW